MLLPVFSVGRVQELLAILNQHWSENEDMQQYKIFYISSIGEKYGERLAHVTYKTFEKIDSRNAPCVIFATPGMLQSGLSRELFEELCDNEINLLLITGYAAKGSYLQFI